MELFDNSRARWRSQANRTPSDPSSVSVQEQDSATIITSHPGASTYTLNPPTTMTWAGQSGAVAGSVYDQGSQPDLPPDYSQARIPTDVVIYTFSPQGNDTLLLVPPVDSADSRPLYHISVSINPFIPTSSTTTVRRGATEHGELVAEFEWGLMRSVSTITMRNTQVECSRVLKFCGTGSHDNKPEFSWTWDNDEDRKLYWHCNEHLATCYRQVGPLRPNPKKDPPLATFSGRSIYARADKRRQPLSALKVYPEAHFGPLLDYIIVGALMIERRRLSPWNDHETVLGPRRVDTSKW